MTGKRKRKLAMPDTLIIVASVVLLVAILSWIIPSGTYDYQEMNINGRIRNVAIDGTYHTIDKSEVTTTGFLGFFSVLYRGCVEAADVIFMILCCCGTFGVVVKTGAFHAGIGTILKKLKGKEILLVPIIMMIFGLGGSVFGMASEFYGFYPLIVGLELYRYEFAGLLMHAEHLEAVFGVGPHTISVPRIRRADDIDPENFSNAISDDVFEKIVGILRIAVPYTGLIISTRESKAARERVLKLGVSQISGGSRTSVGGYVTPETEEENSAQFDVSDNRTLDQVVNWLLDLGYIPSFCTACYREGRTGDRFMHLVKSGQIANCCQPNALMTLKEYLEDYASPDTQKKGEQVIAAEIPRITNDKVREIAKEHLKELHDGKRDFRF